MGKLTQNVKNMEPIYDSDMRMYLHAELPVCCQCIFFLILLVTNQLALLLWLGERFLLLKRAPECFYDYISVSSACDVCIRMSHMASLNVTINKIADQISCVPSCCTAFIAVLSHDNQYFIKIEIKL